MDPLQIGELLIPLAGLAGLYLKINQAVRTMSGKGEAREISNNPLHVQEAPRPATVLDFQRLERRMDKLEKDVKANQIETGQFRDKIHDEIAELRDRMDDKLTTHGETLRSIERSLGRLEARNP